MTAVVDHTGRVRASLPEFRAGVLEASIAGRTGSTPFTLAGNAAAVLTAALLFLVAARRSRRA
jgi:apolipoprotein N-acyltransferase